MFKNVMSVIIETLGTGMVGIAIGQAAINNNYKASTIVLFVASTLLLVGYFAERLSD